MKNQYPTTAIVPDHITPLLNFPADPAIIKTNKCPQTKHLEAMGYNDYLDRAGLGFWRYQCHSNQLELCPVSVRMTGLNKIQRLQTVARFIHPLTRGKFFSNIRDLALTGNGFEEEIHLVLENGDSRWFKLTGIMEQQDHAYVGFGGTITDITTLKNTEMMQMDLMAFMSHELKGPLAVLRLYVQGALKFGKLKGNSFLEQHLGSADLQISKMDNLVNRYLNESVNKHSRQELISERFDFSQMVRECASMYASINPDLVFKAELSEGLMVWGDRSKLLQVADNFISNAVKFSKANCYVKIICKREKNHIRFAVIDHGIGINKADQGQLFTRHFRAANVRTGSIKGHGLGLYLCKQIIGLHQGTVFFESKQGVGSVFGFTLPVKPAGN